MRHPDYDRAFHDTPDYIRAAIELGMRKGEKRMKMRQKFVNAVAVAAAFALILGAAAYGASRLAAPKPDNCVASHPQASSRDGESGGSAPSKNTKHLPGVVSKETVAPAMLTPESTPEPEFPEIVYYTEGGLYFHIERECSGMESGIVGSVDDAYHAGKEPCPICLADWDFEVSAVPKGTPAPTAEAGEEAVSDSVEFGQTETTEAGEVEIAEEAKVDAKEAEFQYAYLGFTSEDSVYCAPDDIYFHFSTDCSELKGPITVVSTMGEAMEDHMACEKCRPMRAAVIFNGKEGVMKSAATGDVLVYYNPNGNYFHLEFNCSGMQGAALHTAREAIEARKFPCPVCIGESEELYWLPVPKEDGDSVFTSAYSGYYHRSGDCFHLPSITVVSYDSVVRDDTLAPCPYCLPELAGAFGSPRCYVADGDGLYHTSSKCKKLSGNTIANMSELEAQAKGRVRCQSCADENAVLPEHGEQFVALFGSWLDSAFPGWIFERADVRDGGADWFVSTDGDVELNTLCACRVTTESDGTVSFDLGGCFADSHAISHDFLTALPEAMLSACERDAPNAILDATEKADAVRVNEIFDNVDAIHVAADPNGGMSSFEIKFYTPDAGASRSSTSVTLRWRRADGGYELCDVDSFDEGGK